MVIVIKKLVENGMQFIYTSQIIFMIKVWIERCEQSGHGISWEGVASLVKAAHRNGDRNLTEREIDLAYGLKDKMASILINHSKYLFYKLHFNVHVVLSHVLLHNY